MLLLHLSFFVNKCLRDHLSLLIKIAPISRKNCAIEKEKSSCNYYVGCPKFIYGLNLFMVSRKYQNYRPELSNDIKKIWKAAEKFG